MMATLTADATARSVPRAVRQMMPMARDVVEAIAVQNGVCVRPVPLRRIDTHTGRSEIIDVPCGATLEAKCPSCAWRNRHLRMAQCREGWHLDEEPAPSPDEPDDYQRHLVELRAELQAVGVSFATTSTRRSRRTGTTRPRRCTHSSKRRSWPTRICSPITRTRSSKKSRLTGCCPNAMPRTSSAS